MEPLLDVGLDPCLELGVSRCRVTVLLPMEEMPSPPRERTMGEAAASELREVRESERGRPDDRWWTRGVGCESEQKT